jgi:hypothetical protein
MRRLVPILGIALLAAACTEPLPESDDWSPAVVEEGVVLWRLADGPSGFVGVGGAVTAEDLEDPTRALPMSAYLSEAGLTWEQTFTFGETTGPVFGLAGSADRYAVAGSWVDGPAVYLSADGAAWFRVELPAPPGSGFELEPAAIADDGSTVVVFGYTPDPTSPLGWTVDRTGRADPIDVGVFETEGRVTAAAAGPGGFVAALRAESAAASSQSGIWRSADGADWQPVLAGFPEDTVVTGLIGGRDGYVALVGEDGQQEDFTVWSSADGIDWLQRADDQTVFDLLDGTSGVLYDAVTGPPAAENAGSRPVAFSFGGYWLEIPAAYDGEPFVSVAVAANDARRIASGIGGSGSDLRVHVLAADP